jgi:hypothetical protein
MSHEIAEHDAGRIYERMDAPVAKRSLPETFILDGTVWHHFPDDQERIIALRAQCERWRVAYLELTKELIREREKK